MGEVDRRAHRLTALDGRPLPSGAFTCYSFLWTFVRSDAARADRAGGPVPEVSFTKERLASDPPQGIGCSERTVERHLADLLRGRWIEVKRRMGPLWIVRLYNPDRRQTILETLSTSTTIEAGVPGSKVTTGSDPPRQSCRRSPTELTPGPTSLSEISDSPVGPRIVNSLNEIVKLSTPSLEAFTRAARERGEVVDTTALAIEIVSRAIPPAPPATPIPATRAGVRHLVACLEDGHSLDDLLGLLNDAPAIVAAGLREPDRYGPDMFVGDILTRWRRARMTLQSMRLLEAPRPAPIEVAAPTATTNLASLSSLAEEFA